MKVKNLNHVLQESKTEHDDFIVGIANMLGTSKFIVGLTLFFALWLGGNMVSQQVFHKAIDPAPFLLVSTCINIYSAYTISVLLKADRAEREREQIRNNHEHEINQNAMNFAMETLNEVRSLRTDLELIHSGPQQPIPHACLNKDCNEG